MDGQMTIYDYPEYLPDNTTPSTFDLFHEHCKHRGWLKRDEDTDTAYWMCDYTNRQPAKCWADWQECKECNCPLIKEKHEQSNKHRNKQAL